MLRGRTIAVGVSGGIAAYKACELVRALRGRGAAVIVVVLFSQPQPARATVAAAHA